jgi:hydrogenase maturation protein HypF
VGFRPFVYRLAQRHRLSGWVRNTPAGVVIEAQGDDVQLDGFLGALTAEAPPLAVITTVRSEEIEPVAEEGFAILASGGAAGVVQVAPDCDVCPDCLAELFDPADRRFRYPFITCTNCGPRYSIITGIPYDRPFTTMAHFAMCPACRVEYEDPANRRFHAQPIACPACGPQLSLTDVAGYGVPGEPLIAAIELLRAGQIVAVKGIGGYHLAVDACNDRAVGDLRRRKKRDEKPFALMAPDPAGVRTFAQLDSLAERLLAGSERPIVLLEKRAGNAISPQISPANGYFGVMLPSSPLHHLLLRDNFTALVMTSGNLSDEPIAYRDAEARERLAGIADAFLGHDREIHTRCDDSVLRVFQGNPLFLRRSRGYVPRGIALPAPQRSVLAVGAELKGTICLTREELAFLSQHIGDLKNVATLRSLEETAAHLGQILEIRPQLVAHDLHPDYLSTRLAAALGLPKVAVQHHHAHLAACMAEHRLTGEVLGVIFDGTGYGADGTVWGGEFLLGGYAGYRRVGHLDRVPLPGGDAAVREPLRMAIAWLHRVFGATLFDLHLACLAGVAGRERQIYLRMIERGINSPLTSSCGRLFDAVAALLGVRSKVSYEGQAAIELEALAEQSKDAGAYPYSLVSTEGVTVVDVRPMLRAIIADLAADEPKPAIARRFHATVARAAADVCGKVRAAWGVDRVVLSGGVFQNRLLSEELAGLLEAKGFQVFVHRLVPPNDGGVALGQAAIAGYGTAPFSQSRR